VYAILKKLGWRYGRRVKGVFVDGHERPDVVEYRDGPGGYIETLLEYAKRFPFDRFTGSDNEEQNNFNPEPLPEGTRPMIPVFHDETTCYANEGLPCTWLFMKDGVGPKLQKKGNGKSIMIAGYITPVDKQLLQLPADDPTSLPRVPLSDYVQAVAEYVGGVENEDQEEAKNDGTGTTCRRSRCRPVSVWSSMRTTWDDLL
jgi:hypothetical protein